MNKIAISQIAEQFFRVILGIGLAYFLMEQAGPELGAAGAIMGATIGAVASILYLIITYLRGSKQRKIDIKNSKHFRDESVITILKKTFSCCNTYNNRCISNAISKYDR